jgi:hypothetical protein
MRRWVTLAQWVLALTAVIYLLFGLTDIPTATPDDAASLTGQTADQLAESQPQAYALVQAQIRAGGVQLATIGLFALAVLWFAFRRKELWAWWTLWLLPLLSAAIAGLTFTSTAQGQSPAVPAYSGLLFAVVGAFALLVAAPSFFRPASASAAGQPTPAETAQGEPI